MYLMYKMYIHYYRTTQLSTRNIKYPSSMRIKHCIPHNKCPCSGNHHCISPKMSSYKDPPIINSDSLSNIEVPL